MQRPWGARWRRTPKASEQPCRRDLERDWLGARARLIMTTKEQPLSQSVKSKSPAAAPAEREQQEQKNQKTKQTNSHPLHPYLRSCSTVLVSYQTVCSCAPSAPLRSAVFFITRLQYDYCSSITAPLRCIIESNLKSTVSKLAKSPTGRPLFSFFFRFFAF